jgi:hypothetical protein
MIGIATTFFWIFLLAYFISAAYSAKDLHFELGEPTISLTEENQVLLALPVTLTNNGLYSIGLFNVTSEIYDKDGLFVAEGSTFVSVIRRGEEVKTAHNIVINITDFLQNHKNYLFEDSELNIHAALSLRLAEIIPIEASTNLSIPWGAPFYNFSFGEPEITNFNFTHFRVTVSISFENHAFFDIGGNVRLKMYNDADFLVSQGEIAFEAQKYSSYVGFAEFYVLAGEVSHNGRFEVYFATPIFNCGPLVISYG